MHSWVRIPHRSPNLKLKEPVSLETVFLYRKGAVTYLHFMTGFATATSFPYSLVQLEGFTTGLILGPLWSLAIGLPSLIWCGCFSKWREKHKVDYNSLYTEKWVNRLGEKYK